MLPFPVWKDVQKLTGNLKMTKFANLSLEAIELIEGNPPGEEVEEAIRLVSEKKDTRFHGPRKLSCGISRQLLWR